MSRRFPFPLLIPALLLMWLLLSESATPGQILLRLAPLTKDMARNTGEGQA